MRVSLVIAMATLTLGLASRPLHGQMTRPGDAPLLQTINMVDSLTGWAVTEGVNIFLRTTDGGRTWRDITPAISPVGQIRVRVFAAISSLSAWVASESSAATAQIFRTVDGGRTWRSVTISTPEVNSIQFIDAPNGWLLSIEGHFAGSNAVAIYHSSDGGETWVKISAMTFGAYKKAATFLDATTGWVTGDDIGGLPLFVTHDGGRTWQPQKLPLPPLPSGISSWESSKPMPPKFFTARDGVLPVFYSGLPTSYAPVVVFYATNNRGKTWTPTTPVPVSGVTTPVDYVDSNHGWIADGVMHATRDGGRRWVTVQPKELPGDVTQLNFISPQVGWAIGWGISDEVIPLHKTLDGGRTWTPVPYTIVRQ